MSWGAEILELKVNRGLQDTIQPYSSTSPRSAVRHNPWPVDRPGYGQLTAKEAPMRRAGWAGAWWVASPVSGRCFALVSWSTNREGSC